VIKIVVTGSESTGKTELARELGLRLDAPVSEEFARTFAASKRGAIDFADHGPIARGQMAAEDEAIRRATGLVILDTDLVSTVVYCEHYFGRSPEWIEAKARRRAGDLYLLLTPDVPWVADGVRDRGGRRDEMHVLFKAKLAALALPYVEIGGAWDTRIQRAAEVVTALALRTGRG
jgi:NadR type nicotinamide-nucleotide adenylyltransferase